MGQSVAKIPAQDEPGESQHSLCAGFVLGLWQFCGGFVAVEEGVGLRSSGPETW